MAMIVGIGEQSYRAGPLIIPPRIVEDRIEADTLDRDAALNGAVNFGAHVVKPGRTARAFGAGFSDQDRSPIALVHFRQHVAERPIGVMPHWARRPAMIPLVVGVIIDADDVDELGRPAEFRL